MERQTIDELLNRGRVGGGRSSNSSAVDATMLKAICAEVQDADDDERRDQRGM